jgi:hypothetical protein
MQVCLSLLGTWHGTNESEKWHPDRANLWRILISIQGMILIADPYFNEPVRPLLLLPPWLSTFKDSPWPTSCSHIMGGGNLSA